MGCEPRSSAGPTRRSVIHAFAWSGGFTAVSRASTIVAVPLVLNTFGAQIYAIWVVAGVLIMAQGLVDLGVGAAVVRFVAAAQPRPTRRATSQIAARASAFYLALSTLVGVPLWIWAYDVAGLVSGVTGTAQAEGATVVRYAAIAFALTNLIIVIAAVLQGVGRVAVSYRAQMLGWLTYVPALWGGIELGWGVDAIGLAWIVTYVVQLALLALELRPALRAIPRLGGHAPTVREVVSFGGRWQISSWADFATFALPRLVGGLLLTSNALVALDLSLRAAQLVVAPLFAFFPLVLPAAATAWSEAGVEGVRSLVARWLFPGATVLALAAAFFAPLETTVMAAWTGKPVDSVPVAVAVLILFGVVAHASTGLLTSALLAMGEVRPIVSYKTRQLLIAAAFIVPAAWIGVRAVAALLAVALALTAAVFQRFASQRLDLHASFRKDPFWRRLAVSAAVGALVSTGIVLGMESSGSPWLTLAVAAVVGTPVLLVLWRWCRSIQPAATQRTVGLAPRPAVRSAAQGR